MRILFISVVLCGCGRVKGCGTGAGGGCTLVSDWFLGPCRVVYHLLLTKVAVTVLVTSLR